MSSYRVQHVITLRAEQPQTFGKFGAVAESDGKDMLWISSPWANEEEGILWSYNVTDGLARRHARRPSFQFQGYRVQHIFRQDNETAKVFAYGTEPKVLNPCLHPSLFGRFLIFMGRLALERPC